MYKALLGPRIGGLRGSRKLSAMTKVGNDWKEHGDDSHPRWEPEACGNEVRLADPVRNSRTSI